MNIDFKHYMVCWLPENGSLLATIGQTWMGWCVDNGTIAPQPWVGVVQRGMATAPGSARLKGFVGDLSPAFSLTKGNGVWALDARMHRVAARLCAVRIPQMSLSVHRGCLVLRPAASAPALGWVTAELEATLAGLRPHPAKSDACAALGPDTFHIRLTDPMPAGMAWQTVEQLRPLIAPLLAQPMRLTELVLIGDPGNGRPWRLIDRYALPEERVCRQIAMPSGMACAGQPLLEPFETVGLGF